MIVGLGLDVVDVARIEKSLARFGEAFCRRILTPSEMDARAGRDGQAPGLALALAGSFAAKEAAVKALGTGFSEGVTFQCLEVLPDALGRPALRLSGAAAARARAIGAESFHISITHDRGVAAAVAVAEGRDRPAAPACSGCPGAAPQGLAPLDPGPAGRDPGIWTPPGERVFPDPAAKRRRPVRGGRRKRTEP
jgi:holo-[acyl-carrier protein] synthase